MAAFTRAWRGGPEETLRYEQAWVSGDGHQAQLADKFRRRCPAASSCPRQTGICAPALPQCRPKPFLWEEVVRMGICSKHYAQAHKFSPGAMTFCCTCTNPLILAFSVLDRKAAPQVLLNMLVTRFGKMPHFLVYDFGCGAFRAALGKVAWLLADCTVLSDRFHIFNHLCSDLFDPRSYTAMDGVDTGAPEQQNAPIRNIQNSLRGMGVQNYTALLAYKTAIFNHEAQMRAKWVPSACPMMRTCLGRTLSRSRAPAVRAPPCCWPRISTRWTWWRHPRRAPVCSRWGRPPRPPRQASRRVAALLFEAAPRSQVVVRVAARYRQYTHTVTPMYLVPCLRRLHRLS